METTFFRCPICGNVLLKMNCSSMVPNCCGKPMELLKAGTTDGKVEYHVPFIKCCKDDQICIRVGMETHPMTEQHHIQFIYLETEHGGQIHYLKPDEKPEATFLIHDKPKAAYAYCNLHGLWKLDIDSCKKQCPQT